MTEFGDYRLPPRFWSKVRVEASGCWTWTASVNAHGYGLFHRWAGRSGAAHRIAYDALVDALGPHTPTGPQLDHLCRVRSCVNPDHLEVVTPRINSLRGRGVAASRAAQVACIHGHAFAGPNLLRRKDGTRRCRTCHNDQQRRAQAA